MLPVRDFNKSLVFQTNMEAANLVCKLNVNITETRTDLEWESDELDE